MTFEKDFAVLDVVGALNVVLDPEGRILRWNSACSHLTGLLPDEVRGKHVRDLFPTSADADPGAPPGRLRTGVPGRYEDCWLTRAGERRWFAWSTTTITTDGEAAFILATGVDITERKRADDELRRSEQLFRLLVSNAEEYAIYMLDPEGRVATWNAGAERLTGYRAAEILGQDYSVFFPPNEIARGRPKVALRVAATEGRIRDEGWRLRKDGSRFWGSVTVTALRGEETGRLQGFGKIVRDETERKVTEDALRASERRFNGIISIAGDAIVSIDEEQRIVVFNAQAEKMFGYTKEEVLGKNVDTLIPERFRTTHRQDVQAFASGDVYSRAMGQREAVFGVKKNGEEFPAEATISKLDVDPPDRILTVVLRDITDRTRAQMEERFLDAAWGRLVSTLDVQDAFVSLASLVLGTLADWCIVFLVEKGGELRRFRVTSVDPAKMDAAKELQSLPLDPSLPSGAKIIRTLMRPTLMSALSDEDVQSFAQSEAHMRLLRELEPRSAMTSPLEARGRMLGALAVFSTKAGRYGERDLRLAVELARRAALAIDNAKLYQEAQEAIRARDNIMGIVAHDLRNLLNAISISAGSLERKLPRDASGDGAHKLVATELRAAERMNRLIQGLLDVTMIEAGQLSIDRVARPAVELLDEVRDAAGPFGANHTIVVESPPELPQVLADRDRILQVFSNLIGNAVKWTPPGARITIGADARQGEVCFWVADTGCGIPEQDRAHVFDRFWRATAKESKGGTGLGLQICKGIVEGHGGRIWVESEAGAGTTFFFTLTSVPPGRAPTAAPP
jgi:PAS domain S-box-containing protein